MASASHRFHPDSHLNGLADDCPGCEENGRDPFAKLDDENLKTLLFRVERDLPHRSDNEAVAMNVIRDALRDHKKLRSLGVWL